MSRADRIVVGHVRDGRVRPSGTPAPPVGGGERVVGYRDGYPVVRRRPPGRYVIDDATGAVKFEHDLGPNAVDAVTKLEAGLHELRDTVKNLQAPAQKTAIIVAGTVVVGVVVAAVVYYMAQQKKA